MEALPWLLSGTNSVLNHYLIKIKYLNKLFQLCRYVDQGSQAMLDSSQLRNLAPQFRSTPCQAVPAALAGVAHVEGNWSPENNYWFNSRSASALSHNHAPTATCDVGWLARGSRALLWILRLARLFWSSGMRTRKFQFINN